MRNLQLFGAALVLVFATTTSCTAILGIDEDYYKADGGEGGAGGHGGAGGEGGAGGADAGSCDAPKTLCDGQCVDTSLDPDHCGGCNGACPMAGIECQARTCANGICGVGFVMAGVPASTQQAGDCHERQCNGAGKVMDTVKDRDVPDDGNPCTDDRCTSGVPSYPPVTAGTSCDPGGHAVCNGSGACLSSNGQTCAQSADCASSNCVDGVCCDTACSGTCQACSAQKKGSGDDGTCGPIAASTDPDSECQEQAASTCGTTGFCNGNSACELFPATTLCSAATCNGATLNKGDFCNGTGTCADAGTQDCSPYLCANASCLVACTASSQCISTHYCTITICAAKKANGQACGVTEECSSGNCVDGVCCNNACSGICQACNILGSNGTCGNIPLGETDSNPACTGALACNGSGQCLKVNGQSCTVASECVSNKCQGTPKTCVP